MQKEPFPTHDLRFFNRPQTLVEPFKIDCRIIILDASRLGNFAAERFQQRIDQCRHKPCNDNGRKRIQKNKHQPNGSRRDEFCQKHKRRDENCREYNLPSRIHIAKQCGCIVA